MKEIPHKIWKIGDHYIDCGYTPRVVVDISYETKYQQGVSYKKVTPDNYRLCPRRLEQSGLTGRSLVDGSLGDCSIYYCAPEYIHKSVAERWAKNGPLSCALKEYLKQWYLREWGNGRGIWWNE